MPQNCLISISLTDCMNHIPTSIKLWLEVELYLKTKLRYVNVNKWYAKIDGPVCKALPAYQAFTVSDFTGLFPFLKKGKFVHLNSLRRVKLFKLYSPKWDMMKL